ncbi:N4-gp56 family major capsid protein [bacterium]|nr:N4-gp56 family major capsid protein [bacterium]|tara:strand:+ start:23 stop:1159 length:1137 start_codon:yes stop_codon:yes gene_type:complete
MPIYTGTTDFDKIAFEEKVFREKLSSSYWMKFSGADVLALNNSTGHINPTIDGTMSATISVPGSPIMVYRDLEGKRGAKIKIPIVKALVGEGLRGSQDVTLEDNLEELQASNFEIELEEYLHGVTERSPLGRQRSYFDLIESCSQALIGWGIERIDELCFEAIEKDPSNVIYAGGVNNVANLTDNDKITIDLLREAKVQAQAGFKGKGAARTHQKFRINPYKYQGKDYYFVIVPPDVMYDLQKDTEFQDAMKYAYDRGNSNPLFTGAAAITMDGLVVFSHDRVFITDPAGTGEADWGSGADVPGAKVTLFGQNALAIAIAKAPSIDIGYKDLHKRFINFGYQGIFQVKKIAFDNQDYGVMQIRCARTRLSDIARNGNG